MRKLILRCGFAPGDIVMLTAAVRDLHYWNPGQFLTDVRTVCPDLWENNPYITALSETDPEVEQLECTYPLIDQSNSTPYHCLHGFIEFFNERLRLALKPTAFKGDIRLSRQEKAWYSQVHEVTGKALPFWIVAAGGKYDVTIKWWQAERYQEVIDRFHGRIQFVQVGAHGHHHPKLEGAIDLRGQTSLRELIRLVYHSQGVLCSVTALMHLAAAVETKRGCPPVRPCVVVAGGREPAHWEAYPGHQFIHTNGALPCCLIGGCWKDRIARLRDGDERDRPGHLCENISNQLPRCMDMITPGEVVRRVETYFRGGSLKYLSPSQQTAAAKGVAVAAAGSYDRQPLNLHSAGMACDRFLAAIPPCPHAYQGRGIVICGGGIKYFTNAWVCVNMLRRLGCRLPVQVWHLGPLEMDRRMKSLLAPLDVECVDAFKVQKKFPVRILRGWELKPYAILHSPFREVLLLDADNVPITDPTTLFDIPPFKRTGAVFWPDYENGRCKRATPVWRSCGMRQPAEPEFETGQILLDKHRCWPALRLCVWFNENSDFYYQYLHGDKETFHIAFRKLRKSYSMVPVPVRSLQGIMCQHDFQGRRIFQHRNTDKWDLFLRNRPIRGFRFDKECRDYLVQLRRVWDGGMSSTAKGSLRMPARSRRGRRELRFMAVMIPPSKQTSSQNVTLDNLAKTDWGQVPLCFQIEDGSPDTVAERRAHCAYLALKQGLKSRMDYILFLDGSLEFNFHLRQNLTTWEPIRSNRVSVASLYNPGVRELACDLENNARITHPNYILNSPALLISRTAAAYFVRRWKQADGTLEIKISRLAASLRHPVLYHAPSLAAKMRPDEPDEKFQQAIDFHPRWRA